MIILLKLGIWCLLWLTTFGSYYFYFKPKLWYYHTKSLLYLGIFFVLPLISLQVFRVSLPVNLYHLDNFILLTSILVCSYLIYVKLAAKKFRVTEQVIRQFWISKTAEIVAQQLLIYILLSILLLRYESSEALLYLVVIFTCLHLPLLLLLKQPYALVLVASAVMGAYVFGLINIYLGNGLVISFGIHMFFYCIITSVFLKEIPT